MLSTHTPDPQDAGAWALTDRQRQVYTLIERYTEVNEEAPSVSFLARRLAVHPTTVQAHLEALHRKGWLPTARPWLRRR